MIHFEPCEDTLRRMDDNSVDLIVTSPPYNIGKMHSNNVKYGSYANNDMDESDYQSWQVRILQECYRVLTASGSVFYNHKVRIKGGIAIHPMCWILKTNFILKQEITWDMGKSANCDKIRFFPFSERIYWLTKNSKVKISNVNGLSDVWRCVPTHQRKDQNHIAVMPDKIVQYILDSIPVKPNLVYDPFGGSGTTLKVCMLNGINCVISEIDAGKEYAILKKLGDYSFLI